MAAQHLKLHTFTGNTDHDLTGLMDGQIIYVKDGVDGIQSTGLYSDELGALTASTISATTMSAGTIYSGSTDLYDIFGTVNKFSVTTTLSTTGTTITHNLNTNYITCAFWDVSGNPAIPQYQRTSANAISVTVASTGTYDIVIQG